MRDREQPRGGGASRDGKGRGSKRRFDADGPLEREPPPEFAAAVQITDSERVWVRKHLGPFYERQLIEDVIRRVKAGKEATVYTCTGHLSTGRALIAAKVYRQRSQRSSKNASDYYQGRGLLDEEGNSVRQDGRRSGKPVRQNSKRGKAALQTSWLMHEYTLLEALHNQGGDVPQPIASGDNAVLMEFVGDENGPAPSLNDVEIPQDQAQTLFDRVLFNVELLLGMGWVHGDLSAYNMLYHGGRIVLIDFPQVTDCNNNPRARGIFERDIERIAQYFERSGLVIDAPRLAKELWSKHVPEQELLC